MAIAITVPRLGWSMDEGVFGTWLKREGEWVAAGELLFVLESDKAAQEIESFDEGVLRFPPDAPASGAKVKVGQVIGYLLARGEQPPWLRSPDSGTPSTRGSTATTPPEREVPQDESEKCRAVNASAGPAMRRLARELHVDLAQVRGTGPRGRIQRCDVEWAAAPQPQITPVRDRIPSSPRARRVARELGVDWKSIRGSGRGGRIRERDVRAASQGGAVTVAVSSPSRSSSSELDLASKANSPPGSSLRRLIAERMLASLHTTAPVTLTTKVDATNLINLRAQFKAAALAGEVIPGVTDLVIKLVAGALRRHPQLNARWEATGPVLLEDIHIGVAVDTDAGLLVPVIRNVSSLSIKELAARSRVLVDQARSRKVSPDDLRGGTFTVTNLGAFGIDAFTPVINLPETAILGVGAIRREPRVLEDDRIVAGDTMTLSLTFDHRIVDGAPAARFLQTVREAIENPAAWLIP